MNLAIARRNPKRFAQPKVIGVRAMVPGDLEYLRQRSYRVRLRNIREVHHNIARLLAAGLTNREVAERLGYTETRISVLKADPSIAELIRSFQAEIHASWRDHVDVIHEDAMVSLKISNRLTREKLEALDEKGGAELELSEIAKVSAIRSDLMDRFGYGKHQTSTNINVNFASKLEAAISKAQAVTLSRTKVIDNE